MKEELKQEQENCCTPVGQIKRYVDCHGCDRKPKQEQEICNHCGKTFREQMKGCGETTCYRQFLHKQETLEEVAEVYANKKGDIPTTKLEDFGLPKFGTKEFNNLASGFFGGKPKQERMYSEIELEVAFFEGKENNLSFIEWFEQFKKK